MRTPLVRVWMPFGNQPSVTVDKLRKKAQSSADLWTTATFLITLPWRHSAATIGEKLCNDFVTLAKLSNRQNGKQSDHKSSVPPLSSGSWTRSKQPSCDFSGNFSWTRRAMHRRRTADLRGEPTHQMKIAQAMSPGMNWRQQHPRLRRIPRSTPTNLHDTKASNDLKAGMRLWNEASGYTWTRCALFSKNITSITKKFTRKNDEAATGRPTCFAPSSNVSNCRRL